MIIFKNINQEKPFLILKEKYDLAVKAGQNRIEAISLSSYNQLSKEVDSRYVNIKIIDNNEFIFFSNYNSPKSIAFSSHNQIAAIFYWESINTQIRIKAEIKRTSRKFSQKYFYNRSKEKNALAISSNQSEPIDSYNEVQENYKESLRNNDFKKCPDYWGGYRFIPYEFEFWTGHEFRINQRIHFKLINNQWEKTLLQP